jgi:hypothetical protein
MAWARFRTIEADALRLAALKSGRFKSRKSRIGIRPDGTEFEDLAGVDRERRRHEVWVRAENKCQGCGAFLFEHQGDWDHIRSRGRGGDDSLENGQWLGNRFSACQCHIKKHVRVMPLRRARGQ